MQKAILVGVNLNENLDFDHSMEELENLAEACEIEAAAQGVQNLPMVNNAFYIGTGKVEEGKKGHPNRVLRDSDAVCLKIVLKMIWKCFKSGTLLRRGWTSGLTPAPFPAAPQ